MHGGKFAGSFAMFKKMKVFTHVSLLVAWFFVSIPAESQPLSAFAQKYSQIQYSIPVQEFNEYGPISYDYQNLFMMTRNLLVRKQVRQFLREELGDFLLVPDEMQRTFGYPDKIKQLSEGQLLLMLQANPQVWPDIQSYLVSVPEVLANTEEEIKLRAGFRELFRAALASPEARERYRAFNDPTKPVPLVLPNSKVGFEKLRLYVNHKRIHKGKTIPADDLEMVWVEFIRNTKKQIAINVFDFDLIRVAQELVVARHKRNVDVRVGIDAKVIQHRPQVKAVYDLLVSNGIKVQAVDSVGLNHQKMATRDWELPGESEVLLSSGNLTQSCIGAKGDLGELNDGNPYSIPNANHTILTKSWLLAQLINNELTKTIDMKLRGVSGDRPYPLNGAYIIYGENGSYLIAAFSPGGGLGDINEHIIARTIRLTTGPVRMLQFAFSSDRVENALLERAEIEKLKGKLFDFKSVGDKPFALSFWSMFLKLSGLSYPQPVQKNGSQVEVDVLAEIERDIESNSQNETITNDKKMYSEIAENPWVKLLGDKYPALRDQIRVPSKFYGVTEVNGQLVNAKIHHKVIISGPAVVTGSFNFSKSALTNQEHLFVIVDENFAMNQANSMFEGIWVDTNESRSVYNQAILRNRLNSR